MPSRLMRKPVAGMTTAMVSMNAVVSHWPVVAVTPRSAMIGGSATDIVVSLRITVNALAMSSAMTRRWPGASLSVRDGTEVSLDAPSDVAAVVGGSLRWSDVSVVALMGLPSRTARGTRSRATLHATCF